tara:strand:+ start:179 stop:679 length:501 start_codon:yes stop_codon:yes gene_type:complete
VNIDNTISSKLRDIKVICFDFDGVFTDNKVYTDQFGHETVCCNRSDGIGISNLKKLGVKVYVVSTEKNRVVSMRCAKLKIECFQAIEDKAEILLKISDNLSIPLENFAFVGNDINDLPALKIVGMPIAVADSFPTIFEFCSYITKKKGGSGAVREICDNFIIAKNK